MRWALHYGFARVHEVTDYGADGKATVIIHIGDSLTTLRVPTQHLIIRPYTALSN